ncbi:flagellar brake domain-containing protein [Clostridium sp. JN-9]|uniref:flagellar brake protein n=1 Tax=Clostridium sp. JN-9 TaxID=2507159 RepID=UPI0013E8B28D|nr:flagellar brake domain-containing protein [Clostridium sp. JN-9]
MTSKAELKLNSKIDVIYKEEVYVSNVQDIDSENIAISIPVKEGMYLPLSLGERVSVIFYADGDAYKFKTIVTGRKRDNIYVILLKYPSNIVKIQRRNYVRIETLIDVNCTLADDTKKTDIFDAVVTDISGGGLKIVTKKHLRMGSNLIINLPIKEENLVLKGRVVRHELNVDKKHVCGIAFKDMLNENREKIIRYIFELMREQRKKNTDKLE